MFGHVEIKTRCIKNGTWVESFVTCKALWHPAENTLRCCLLDPEVPLSFQILHLSSTVVINGNI